MTKLNYYLDSFLQINHPIRQNKEASKQTRL